MLVSAPLLLTHVFPVIRFVPTSEWYQKIWIAYGPLLMGFCFVVVWGVVLSSPTIHNDRTLSEAANAHSSKPNRSVFDTPGASFANKMFLLPPALWCVLSTTLSLWFPMATGLIANDAVEHRFVVADVSSTKGGHSITFADNFFLVGGLADVPRSTWRLAEPGDTIKLTGKGNQWGVFYDRIQVIKQR